MNIKEFKIGDIICQRGKSVRLELINIHRDINGSIYIDLREVVSNKIHTEINTKYYEFDLLKRKRLNNHPLTKIFV